MYDLLVKLMAIAALAHFGMSLADIETCHSRKCAQQVEKHSREILRADWKPISVFSEEAARFR